MIFAELEVHGTMSTSAVPSVRLTALPKKEGVYQDAYWAPFSVATGKSMSKWQKLSDEGKKKPLSIRLVPSELLWAPTKSSVWPSDAIRKAVPLGEYNLPLQFEVNTGKTFGSDKVRVPILK
jgi:hypothetical protein